MSAWGCRPARHPGPGRDKLPSVFVAVDQVTWDWIGQIGVWVVGFPALVGVLLWYIWAQVVIERREHQRTLDGRWGLAAKAKSDAE